MWRKKKKEDKILFSEGYFGTLKFSERHYGKVMGKWVFVYYVHRLQLDKFGPLFLLTFIGSLPYKIQTADREMVLVDVSIDRKKREMRGVYGDKKGSLMYSEVCKF